VYSDITQQRPRLVVFTTLFPSTRQPTAGLFIRERMFRIARHLPLVVVAPQPWFPFQGLIRSIRPHFRPPLPEKEFQQGVVVHRPKFFSIPGLFKSWDGWLLSLSLLPFMRRLHQEFAYDIIDAHFGYPDGYAAVQIGKQLKVPVTITMRGTEARHAEDNKLRPFLVEALKGAVRVFTVSDSLRRLAVKLGVGTGKALVIANGVDVEKFYPVDKKLARRKYGLPMDARVMITVGGLVERKGFHRVIEAMPELLHQNPNLHYLIVGGGSSEGDWSAKLETMVKGKGLVEQVHFLGVIPPEELRWPLSASDLFVLSTRNEGWANVILEAMACGLPVVASDVGGNAEIVCAAHLGTIVPYDVPVALQQAINKALAHKWQHDKIVAYARDNNWEKRVTLLIEIFIQMYNDSYDTVSTKTL